MSEMISTYEKASLHVRSEGATEIWGLLAEPPSKEVVSGFYSWFGWWVPRFHTRAQTGDALVMDGR